MRSAETGAKTRIVEPARRAQTMFGERAFAVAGPLAWNHLPHHVREIEDHGKFRNALKTSKFLASFAQAPLE